MTILIKTVHSIFNMVSLIVTLYYVYYNQGGARKAQRYSTGLQAGW
jgi:hypothetical protein